MGNHGPSVRHLKRIDPVLARVIEAGGPCRIQLRSEGTHFQALTRAIVFQQLSGKAAGTIFGRFNALYPAAARRGRAARRTNS
jgi:3-methyladenine DNA glycosylase/8-oxoguanine DNA glycosylase